MIDSSTKVCFKVSIALSISEVLSYTSTTSTSSTFSVLSLCFTALITAYGFCLSLTTTIPPTVSPSPFKSAIPLLDSFVIFTTAISFIFKGMLFIVFMVVFSISSTDFK